MATAVGSGVSDADTPPGVQQINTADAHRANKKTDLRAGQFARRNMGHLPRFSRVLVLDFD